MNALGLAVTEYLSATSSGGAVRVGFEEARSAHLLLLRLLLGDAASCAQAVARHGDELQLRGKCGGETGKGLGDPIHPSRGGSVWWASRGDARARGSVPRCAVQRADRLRVLGGAGVPGGERRSRRPPPGVENGSAGGPAGGGRRETRRLTARRRDAGARPRARAKGAGARRGRALLPSE